jgi:menaquinone-dependent protoporphyrinogen oxidase
MTMKTLITFASRHGSTSEIADALAEELRLAGRSVAVRPVEEVEDLANYEAVIVGSAVYMGNWLPEARHFVERHREVLATVPVWLFSSGPLGEGDLQPHGDPAQLDAMMRAIHARDHRLFVGKLDPSELGFGERLMAKVVRTPEGDFRDWGAIRAWARKIAMALPARAISAS